MKEAQNPLSFRARYSSLDSSAYPDIYEHGRPGFPEELVRFLRDEFRLRPGKVLLDLAPGSGKLIRCFVSSGADLFALAPLHKHSYPFCGLYPWVMSIGGQPDQLPLKAGSVDAIIIPQAFHRLSGKRVLREAYRILRPDGKLALIWNCRNEANDWMFQLTKMLNVYERGAPQYRTGRWREAFLETGLFVEEKSETFNNVQRGNIQTVLDRVASISFISCLPAHEKRSVLEDVSNLLRAHPMTGGHKQFDIPYLTDVFLFKKTH